MGVDSYTLLTGATGLLGQFLLVELLRCRRPVAVLVRPDRSRPASERIEFQLKRFEAIFSRSFPRPVILSSSLNSPDLELPQTEQKWISRNCDRVLHCAANLSFRPASEHPQGEPITTNVTGTKHLIQFCRQSEIREFHYVSSAYVCGLRTGTISESEGQVGQKFANDYEGSKATAEAALHAARNFEQLTIYRPSIVIDSGPSSQQLSDRTIYYAFSIYQGLAARFGIPNPCELLETVGLNGNDRKNIVPADWVARIIVQILRRPQLHGRTYHLTSPLGTPLSVLDQAFCDVLRENQAAFPKRVRPSAEESLTISGQFVETFTPYFRDDPKFDQSNLLEALQACGDENCPTVAVSAIAEQARRQRSIRPAPTPVSTDVSLAAWGADCQVQGNPQATSANCVGLVLTGTGGGDWVFNLAPKGITISKGGAETQTKRIYTSAQTWNDLMQGRMSAQWALAAGYFTCEFDEVPENDAARLLDSILDGLREQKLSDAGREVVVYAE